MKSLLLEKKIKLNASSSSKKKLHTIRSKIIIQV
jgi:hypothetical protein